MRRRIHVAATVLAVSLVGAGFAAQASSASQIRAIPNGGGTAVAFTGAAHVLAASNIKLGPALCSNGNGTTQSALVAKGTITNNAITTTVGVKGNISGLVFGSPLTIPSTSTLPANAACPSTVSGLGNCTTSIATPFNISAQDVSGGVRISFGPLTGNLSCTGSGSGTISCAYTTGTGGVAAAISSDTVALSSGSNVVNTAKFTSQPLYRSSGSPACPSSSTFDGTVALYADSTSGALNDRVRRIGAF